MLKGKGAFARGVMVLIAGTASAQALAVLALPLLTRLYTPEDFGVLGIFTAFLGIVAVIAGLRYHIAIPLCATDSEAANLAAVALVSVLATTVLTAIAVLPWGGQIASMLNTPMVAKYLWLLPIGVLLTGAYAVFQYWATRKKAYGRIARTRIEQAIGGVGSQLALGWAGMGAIGLIVGQIISNGAGFIGLARRAWGEDRESIKAVNLSGMRQSAYEYRRFPQYSTLEALTNTAGLQVPLMLIAALASSAELGFLMLAMRILQAPMSLVGTSIGQVYYAQAVQEHSTKRLWVFTLKTLRRLAFIGLPPLAVIAVIAPYTFGLLFGNGWERTGEIAVWLLPFFFFQFLASPVSMSLHILGKQRLALLLQLFGLLLRVSSLFWIPGKQVEAFAVSSCIFYMVYLGVILLATRKSGLQVA